MTKAKSRHGMLKGAVLLMVLAVMTVLIIMLAGAMAIVSTSSNRANTQYQESQAYYTARSGIEVITQTLMGDSVHVDKGTGNDGNNNKSANATALKAGGKSQALVLEEAITGVLKEDPSNTSKMIYDVSKSLTAWDTINNPTGAGLTENQKKQSYMIFNVSDISSFNSGESGTFASTGDGSVQVKIQLLELNYDTGAGVIVARNDIPSTNKLDVTNGDKEKYYIDSIAIMIECTATYNGVSSTVSKVVSPISQDKTQAAGFNSTGDLQMSTNSSVLGGAVSAGTFSWGNDGTTAGSSFVNENSTLNAQKVFALGNTDSLVINGDFNAQNNMVVTPSGAASATDHPFVFVNGTLSNSSQPPIIGYDSTGWGINNCTPSSTKTDLIVKNLKGSSNGIVFVNGNTYIDGYLQIDFGGTNFVSTNKPFFGGDLFISDREAIDLGDVTAGGTWQTKKTNLGVVNYTAYPNTDPKYAQNRYRIKYSIDTDSRLWNDIITNGGDQFCSGDIYYYYYEKNDRSTTTPTLSSNSTYYGCMELEAIRQYILYIKDSSHSEYNSVYTPNMLGINKFFNKLHPVGPYIESNSNFEFTSLSNPNNSDIMNATNMQYIIQLAYSTSGNPDFVDQFDFTPAGMSGGSPTDFDITIKENPTYLLKISLPKVNSTGTGLTSRLSDPDVRNLPTLFSKYADYFFINDISPLTGSKWVSGANDNVFLDSSGTAEKKDFKYKDSVNNVQKIVTDWKDEVGKIAFDLFKAVNDATNYSYDPPAILHGDLVTRAWDVLNALYEVDASGHETGTKNVNFRTAALTAHIDNNIIFNNNLSGNMDFSSVGNINVTANLPKTYQTLTATAAKNTTTVIDTSSNDVILMLSPGTYENGKIIVSGSNYCYIMMPNSTPASEAKYTFWGFSIVTEQFDSSCYPNTVPTLKVSSTVSASATAVAINAPNIIVYADDNVTFDFYNGGNYSFMGYIYGPGAKIVSNSTTTTQKNLWYEDALCSSVHMDILGSAFVGDINVQNGFSFIYIPPIKEKEDWEPKFNWAAGGVGYTSHGVITEEDVS